MSSFCLGPQSTPCQESYIHVLCMLFKWPTTSQDMSGSLFALCIATSTLYHRQLQVSALHGKVLGDKHTRKAAFACEECRDSIFSYRKMPLSLKPRSLPLSSLGLVSSNAVPLRAGKVGQPAPFAQSWLRTDYVLLRPRVLCQQLGNHSTSQLLDARTDTIPHVSASTIAFSLLLNAP